MPRATVQGIDLYYLLEGPEERPAVALIPGFSAPLEMWGPTLPGLVPDFRVLLYDLRGHGRSDLPFSGYDLATQAGDLLGLMDHVGIEKAHLVGDAAGGGVAVEIALNHPDRLLSLTLVGTRIHGWKEPEGSVPPPTPEEEAYNAEFQRRFKEEGLPEILEQWWLGDWARPAREDPIRRRAQRLRDLVLAYPGGAWHATLPSQPVPPHHPRLGEIRVPTLIMLGGGDLPIILVNGDEWVRCIPNARKAIIPEAGHIPNWEFPEAFNDALGGFLREVSPP